MQENYILRALNFRFSWGGMPPNPPSYVGANHSCKILDPPLYLDCQMGLIRVGGRIHKSSLPDEIILPHQNRFVDLPIQEAHEN